MAYNDTVDRRAADNSTYKKLADQWVNEIHFFNQTFVQADIFMLRNSKLLRTAKGCLQAKFHRTNSTFVFLPIQKPKLKNQKSYFLPTLKDKLKRK